MLIPKRPKEFDAICRKHLSQDPDGQTIMDAFTMQELWEYTCEFRDKRRKLGKDKACEVLQPFFDALAKARLDN